MEKIRYVVYYDTTNNRPRKDFGEARDEAIAWADARPDKRPEVVKVTEEVIHSPWR